MKLIFGFLLFSFSGYANAATYDVSCFLRGTDLSFNLIFVAGAPLPKKIQATGFMHLNNSSGKTLADFPDVALKAASQEDAQGHSVVKDLRIDAGSDGVLQLSVQPNGNAEINSTLSLRYTIPNSGNCSTIALPNHH